MAKHNRNISSLEKGNNGQSSGIYDPNGKIITGTIANWNSLSREEKAKVFNERKRLGIKYSRGVNKDKGERKGKSSKEIDKVKKQNSKLKRTIKALKKKVQFSEDVSDDDNSKDGSEINIDNKSDKNWEE